MLLTPSDTKRTMMHLLLFQSFLQRPISHKFSILSISIEDVSQTLMKTHKTVYIFLITYYQRVQNLSKYRYHTCKCLSVLCPVSVLSNSVESCGICLTRPSIVFDISIVCLSVYFVCKRDNRQNVTITQGRFIDFKN